MVTADMAFKNQKSKNHVHAVPTSLGLSSSHQEAQGHYQDIFM